MALSRPSHPYPHIVQAGFEPRQLTNLKRESSLDQQDGQAMQPGARAQMTDIQDNLSIDNKPRIEGPRPHRASARSVEFRPIEVAVQDGNVNRALSMLKRKMAAEGIYKELRKRRFFEKPSEERKRRGREADRRRKKAVRVARERA